MPTNKKYPCYARCGQWLPNKGAAWTHIHGSNPCDHCTEADILDDRHLDQDVRDESPDPEDDDMDFDYDYGGDWVVDEEEEDREAAAAPMDNFRRRALGDAAEDEDGHDTEDEDEREEVCDYRIRSFSK